MKTQWLKTTVELVGIFGILVSVIFVGFELRDSNRQARAAAFQAIGIATAEFHQTMDDRLNLLYEQAFDPEAMEQWTLSDWLAIDRRMRADLRLFETALLQVEQGLLPEAAINNLGFGAFGNGFLAIPGVACLWPRVSQGPGSVGPAVVAWVEAGTPVQDRVSCPVNLTTMRQLHNASGKPANQ